MHRGCMPITLGRPTRRDSAICTCVSLCWMRITYAARAARTSACACCVASVLANAVVKRARFIQEKAPERTLGVGEKNSITDSLYRSLIRGFPEFSEFSGFSEFFKTVREIVAHLTNTFFFLTICFIF